MVPFETLATTFDLHACKITSGDTDAAPLHAFYESGGHVDQSDIDALECRILAVDQAESESLDALGLVDDLHWREQTQADRFVFGAGIVLGQRRVCLSTQRQSTRQADDQSY